MTFNKHWNKSAYPDILMNYPIMEWCRKFYLLGRKDCEQEIIQKIFELDSKKRWRGKVKETKAEGRG